jgi:hypothetical protein
MKALITALAIVFATSAVYAEAPKKGTNAATKPAKKPAAPAPKSCKDDADGCKKVKPKFDKKQNKAKLTPEKK